MATISDHHPLANQGLDHVFKALSHPARRQIILALSRGRPHDTAGLTMEIADGDHLGQSLTSLRHVHLPYLDDADVLDWDRETNTLTAGPRYETAREILERLATPEAVEL